MMLILFTMNGFIFRSYIFKNDFFKKYILKKMYMKLTLKNFKCYENRIFEFSNILTLIQGVSGKGKSTIFNAILFVLYDKIKKPQMYGKTSCQVEFIFENYKITRSKTPNRLVLIIDGENEYIDDAAQNIIDKKFGDIFEFTSYINQNPTKSFMMISPAEKLKFLQKLVFKDIDLNDIKDKNKTEITLRKDALNKNINNLELASKIFQDMEKPIQVEFPLKGKKINYEKLTKNEEIKLKNCNIRIKKAESENMKIQDELNDIKILLNYISLKEENIENIINQLEYLTLEEKNLNYQGDDKLDEYNTKLKKLLSQKSVIQMKIQYQNDIKKLLNMKQTEIEKYNKEMNKIDNILWKEYAKDETENIIKDLKDCLKDAKHVSYLKKQIESCNKDGNKNSEELENLKNTIQKNRDILSDKILFLEKLEQQKNIYKCPSCSVKLQISDDGLYIPDLDEDLLDKNINDINVIKNDIDHLKKDIKKLEKIIPEYENKLYTVNKLETELNEILSQYEDDICEINILEDLENMNKYYNYQTKIEHKKLDIQNNISEGNFSSSYLIFEKDIKELKKNIDNSDELSEFDDCDIDNEEELRNIIIQEQKNKDNIKRLTKELTSKTNEKIKYEDDLLNKKNKHIEMYGSIKDITELEHIIGSNKKIIEENKNNMELCLNNLEQITKYNLYIENKTKYLKFKNEVSEYENNVKECRKKYDAALKLKEKISEAEAIYLFNIIESINSHAQIYLEYFFPEDPIIIKLLSFKETKDNNKPQINVEIDYKGMEFLFDDLSGGEQARVNLAFTLALNEIFNSKILLLDECTANINEDLTTMIFDTLKEHFKDKYVIVIAHQVIEGIFDDILKLV